MWYSGLEKKNLVPVYGVLAIHCLLNDFISLETGSIADILVSSVLSVLYVIVYGLIWRSERRLQQVPNLRLAIVTAIVSNWILYPVTAVIMLAFRTVVQGTSKIQSGNCVSSLNEMDVSKEMICIEIHVAFVATPTTYTSKMTYIMLQAD
jgi:hypothetical protein